MLLPFLLIFFIQKQVATFPYNFNATQQYLLIEIYSTEWKSLSIQILINGIKQSQISQNYEEYLSLYYKLNIGVEYNLQIETTEDTTYQVSQQNEKTCSLNCSNQGQCNGTVCNCSNYYIGSRCQFVIDIQTEIQQYQVNLNQQQQSFLIVQYQQQTLLNDQGQTKNLIVQINESLDAQIYFILPYQTISEIKNQIYNNSLNGTTVIDYSKYYQAYNAQNALYGFLFAFTNENLLNTQYQLIFSFQTHSATFQDFILVTILSVVAFIILLIVIFIVRKRCQYVQLNKLKLQQQAQIEAKIIDQLQVVLPAKNEECIVCLDILENQLCRQTPCKHTFHEKCLEEWLKKQQSCPLCRENLLEEEVQTNQMKLRNLNLNISSSTLVIGQFSIIQSERLPISQYGLQRSTNRRLAAFQ